MYSYALKRCSDDVTIGINWYSITSNNELYSKFGVDHIMMLIENETNQEDEPRSWEVRSSIFFAAWTGESPIRRRLA